MSLPFATQLRKQSSFEPRAASLEQNRSDRSSWLADHSKPLPRQPV